MVLTLSTKPCSMSSVYSSASMTNQTRRNGSSISASVQEVRSASSHSPFSLHLLEPLGPVRNMDPASLHGLDTVVPSNVHCHCIPPFTSTGHLPIHTISTTGIYHFSQYGTAILQGSNVLTCNIKTDGIHSRTIFTACHTGLHKLKKFMSHNDIHMVQQQRIRSISNILTYLQQ